MFLKLPSTVAVVAAFAMASTMISFTAITTTENQQAYAQVNGGGNSESCNLRGTTSGGSSPIRQTCSQDQGKCLLGQQSRGDASGSIGNSECS
jgi:hypothetical protein